MAEIIKKAVALFWDKLVNVVDRKIIKVTFSRYKCSNCVVKEALWKNTLTLVYACDECVPRGCSCRLYKRTKRAAFLIKQYDYQKDKTGKSLPCEDWEKI